MYVIRKVHLKLYGNGICITERKKPEQRNVKDLIATFISVCLFERTESK